MCDINETESLIRIEKKIDRLIGYAIQLQEKNEFKYSKSKERKAIQMENRKAINKILCTLPDLEKFSELKEISENEVKSFCENLKFKDIIETEDTCVSIFKYDNFIGTFSSTNTSNVDWETSIEIVGTKGSIIFNLDFPERIIEFNLNDSKYNDELQKIVDNYNLNKGKNINYYGLSHNRQFLNFKEAILKHTSLKVDLKEAIKTQEFLDMIYNGE